jgi:hypothetical protein
MEKVSREPNGGCWLWQAAISSNGYGSFFVDDTVAVVRAHRAAWIIFRGPIPPEAHVLHRCDDPLCVNPDHLWLGNNADNMADMAAKGRAPSRKGRKNGRAVLTPRLVRMIRGSPDSATSLAARLGVATSTVARARRGERWAHIDTEVAV